MGNNLLILVMGGGLFFMVYVSFSPFLYFKHVIDVLGKYHEEDKEGEISHKEAL